MRVFARCLSWMALTVLAVGCGEGGPKLYPVEGTVTFDGSPLDNAELTFVPEESNADVTPGTAITADDGTYKARYQGRFGLAEGSYKVMLRKIELAPDITDMPEEMLNDPAQLELGGFVVQKLPDVYADLDKTTFQVDVTPGGGPYDFELDSKGR